MRDVLAAAGVRDAAQAAQRGARHVVFKGADGMEASVPIEKALSEFGDAILAYEMNGAPLPRDHGAPLRAIVPGLVGVRNVKWVSGVVVSGEEARGPWQRGIAYKGFASHVKSFDGVDVGAVLSIQETPVQSVIVEPAPGARVALDGADGADGANGAGGAPPPPTVEARGWAFAGGGRGIVRVEVSADGGASWCVARLTEGSAQPPSRAWAWTFWEADVPVRDRAARVGRG